MKLELSNQQEFCKVQLCSTLSNHYQSFQATKKQAQYYKSRHTRTILCNHRTLCSLFYDLL